MKIKRAKLPLIKRLHLVSRIYGEQQEILHKLICIEHKPALPVSGNQTVKLEIRHNFYNYKVNVELPDGGIIIRFHILSVVDPCEGG